ncbi:MAG: hypothetical protein KC646_11490 [Candidatus Cloacimonetes bacterium]|nr:hypothetical protein [Candidatus Cloacimonadota bacterium]
MKTTQKQRKTLDDNLSYSLSKSDSSSSKENILILSIIEALQLSYANNENDLPVDYKSTIKLLYEKLIRLRSYPSFEASDVERFKVAEASNDLAMAFYASYQSSKNKRDLNRAETFYLYSIDIYPLTITYFNYFSFLKADSRRNQIDHMYKDMLDAHDFKVSKTEIKKIFFTRSTSVNN